MKKSPSWETDMALWELAWVEAGEELVLQVVVGGVGVDCLTLDVESVTMEEIRAVSRIAQTPYRIEKRDGSVFYTPQNCEERRSEFQRVRTRHAFCNRLQPEES